VDYKNTSKQELFEKNDISIKNNGAKIPLPNRKLGLTELLSLRVSDLEDLPKQMSSLFPVICQSVNICCLTMLDQDLTKKVPQNIL
jgi:hypothetical protein